MALYSRNTTGPTKDFPNFDDGDVAVILSPIRIFHFHSSTLRSSSKLFTSLLTEENAAGKKHKLKWRVELRPDEEFPEGTLHVRNPTSSRTWGDDNSTVGFTDLDAGQIPSAKFHHWENLFRCFYALPASIRSDAGIGSVLEDVVKLTDIAEYCGSMRVISLAIDSALVRQGAVLWQSVARSPAAWATLALRTRCEMVFREAICHLVGLWPKLLKDASAEVARLANDGTTYTPAEAMALFPADGVPIRPHSHQSQIALLPAEIRQLCQKKHKVLSAVKKTIEKRILAHYPAHLHRAAWGGRIKPGLATANTADDASPASDADDGTSSARPSRPARSQNNSSKSAAYSTDIMGWMAVSLFRHFIGQALTEESGSQADDGGATFYTAIAHAGDAYLNRDATEEFCKSFPLSAKSRAIFEEQLGLLKEAVRPYVADLVKSRLTLDHAAAKADGFEVKYLTCCIVKHTDMPWVSKKATDGIFKENQPWQTEPSRNGSRDGSPKQPSIENDAAEAGAVPYAVAIRAGSDVAAEQPEPTTDTVRSGSTKKRRGPGRPRKDERAPKRSKRGDQSFFGAVLQSIEAGEASIGVAAGGSKSTAPATGDYEGHAANAQAESAGRPMFFGAGDD